MKKLLLAVSFLLGYITLANATASRYVPPATTPVGTTITGPTGTVSTSPITITITTARPVSVISSSAFTVTNATLSNLTQKLTLAYSAQFGTTGTSGNTSTTFSAPNGIETNGNGVFYVADGGNNRVKILNEGGTQLGVIGSAGSGPGQFNDPYGIALDAGGKIYVTDRGNNRVQIFDSNGILLGAFGSAGSGNLQFNSPEGIYVSSTDGSIYVADAGNNRVQVFNGTTYAYIKTIGSAGNGTGQFYGPTGIAGDAGGNIYVTDSGNGRVEKFSAAGVYTATIGSAGSSDGQFNTPSGITTDGTGKIYVVDNTLHRVQAFTTAGSFLGKLGGTNPGTANTQFNFPTDIAADKNGKFYVVDQSNQRVSVLTGKSVYTATLDPTDNGDVTVDMASSKAFDNNGNGNAAASYLVNYFNAVPSAPTGLTATSLDGKAKLDWNANPVTDDILSYKIFWGTSPNPTTLLTSVSGAVTTYTTSNTPLTNGTTYYYRITAVNSISNESPYSAQVTVIPKANPVVTLNNPLSITYGTQVTTAMINAQANVPGTFTYDGQAAPASTIYAVGGSNNVVVVFHPTNGTIYNEITNTVNISVSKANPVVTLTSPFSITYGTPVTAAMINAQANIPGTFTYDGHAAPAATLYTVAGPNSILVKFIPTDITNYQEVDNPVIVTVQKATPVIDWTLPASVVAKTPVVSLQTAVEHSSIPGTFSYTPASGVLHAGLNQQIKATFTPTDAANYNGAEKILNINVSQLTPTLTWAPVPATITYGTPLVNTQLNASADNGLLGPITYNHAAGDVLSITDPSITAHFAPTDHDYEPVDKTISITINKAAPVVTLTNPVNIAYGTPVTAAMINAQANVPGTFTYDGQAAPAATIYPVAGPNSMVVVFHPTDMVNYNNVTNNVTINVNAVTPVVTFNNPVSFTYGTPITAAMINAQANVPGTFTYDGQAAPLSTIYNVPATNTIALVFHPSDGANYTTVSNTVTLNIAKATPVVTLNNPINIAYGTLVTAAMINAHANVPGTFTYDGQAAPPATIYTVAVPNTLNVVFHPTDAANYNNVINSVTINVSKTDPLVTVSSPINITYGTPVTAAMINPQASVPGTFTYNGQATPPATSYPVNGTNSITVVFHPTDGGNYNNVTKTVTINASKANPLVTLTNPVTIAYGTPVTAAMINAQANVPGTFTYDGQATPPSTIYPVAGPNSIAVVFHPTDANNYNEVTNNVTITANVVNPLVTLNNPVNITYGTQVTAAMINAQANVAGSFTYDGQAAPAATTYTVAGPNSIAVVFHPTDANYNSVTNNVTVNVSKATPVVTLTNPVSIAYGTQVTAAMINANADVPGTFTYDGQSAPPSTIYPVTGTNTITVVFHPTDAANYNPVTNTVNINVGKTDPLVTVNNPVTITYGTTITTAMINAVANVPGTFTYDGQATPPSTVYTVAGPNAITVVFHPTDGNNYNPVTKTVTVNVSKINPMVTLANPVNITYEQVVTAAMINAQANVPGTFTYDGQTTPPSTIYPVAGPNSMEVVFHPTDAVNYNAITNNITINVNRVTPVVTLTNPVAITYGTVVTTAMVNAQANVPGTFTYDGQAAPPSTIYPVAGPNTMVVVFHPTDAANYNLVTNNVTINVSRITPVVTLTNPINIAYGTAVTAAMINAQADVPGTFTYNGQATPPSTTYTIAGPNTITVVFNPTDAANYSSVTNTVTINVTRANPVVTLTNPVNIAYGTVVTTAMINAQANVPGTFTYDGQSAPPATIYPVIGPNSITVVFHPTDAVNYNPVTKTVIINVSKINPLVTLTNPVNITYGQVVTTAMINAQADVPGTFTYDGQAAPAATIYPAHSSNTITVVFHPTNSTNYSEVTNAVTVNVDKITPVVTLTNPVSITYGTPVTVAMINAQASVPGTFTYDGQATPPATVYTVAGPNSIAVVFHPTDAANYNTVTNNVTINVTRITPLVTLNNPVNIAYGTLVTAAMINAQANVPGSFTYDGQATPPATIYNVAGPNSMTVVFHPTDGANYSSVTNIITINVDKKDPVITLNNPVNINYGTTVTAAMINAHANIPGTFTYDGQATPPATIYPIAGPNTMTVVFHPTDGSSYNAVTNTVTINVNRTTPIVTLTNPVNINYGEVVTAAMINAQANVPGTFTYDGQATPPATIYSVAGNNTIAVVFHPTDAVNYRDVTNIVTINVNSVSPVVALTNSINITYGQLVTTAMINAQANVAGTFTYNGQTTLPPTIYPANSTNTIAVVFHPADGNYSNITNTVTINVNRANPVISLNSTVNIVYGTPVTASMINATASIPGSFTYDGQATPPSTIYPVGGNNNITVIFYPTDANNYSAVTNTVAVIVNNTPPVLTNPVVSLNNPVTITYGTTVTAALINAQANVAGAFTYDGQSAPPATIYPVGGANTMQVVFHPTDAATYNTVNKTVIINVNKIVPTVTLNNTVTIAYGTQVTAAMINAQADAPGTFTYDGQSAPPATIYPVAGANTIQVVFHPTDATHYNGVTKTVTIDVDPLNPVVTLNNPVSITYGTPVTATMINAQANVPGSFTYDGQATPPATIYPVSGSNSMLVEFHPTNTNYNKVTNSVAINVSRANPVVTLYNPVTITYGTVVTAASINAHANVPGSFTYDGQATPPSTIYPVGGTNTMTVVFHPTDGTTYTDVTNTVTINVNKVTPIVTLTNPVNIAYGTPVTATMINAQANVPGSFTYDGQAAPAATIYPVTGPNSMVVVFHPTDGTTYRDVTNTITINVHALTPLVTLNNPVSITYGTQVTAAMINAQANVPGSFTYDGMATPPAINYPVNGSNAITVVFHPTDAVTYNSVTKTVAVNVSRVNPVVTLNNTVNIAYGTPVTDAMINAQANVPGSFTYDGQATQPATLYPVNGSNTITVIFHPTDATTYSSVTNTVTVNVTRANPIVTLVNPVNITYGTAITEAMINAQANVPGAFTYDGQIAPPSTIYPVSGASSMAVVFHPTDGANYSVITNTVAINVSRAVPVVTLNHTLNIGYGTPVTSAMINAQANVAGVFTYDGQATPAATLYPVSGSNSMTVIFHPTDGADYSEVTNTVTINVSRGTPLITLTNPVNITYGTPVTEAMINAQSNIAGTFTYNGQATPAATLYPVNGSNSIAVVFHPTDAANYQEVTNNISITVNAAAPNVTLINTLNITYGTAITAAMINAQANVPGTFTYNGQPTPSATLYPVNGANSIVVVFHPADAVNYSNVNNTVTINVTRAMPAVTLNNPVNITYGTPVTTALINAQANIAGSFTYDGQATPPATLYPVTGPNSMLVVFHPTDVINYSDVPNTVNITVAKADAAITFNNPVTITYGQIVTAALINAQANVPGSFTYNGQATPPATIYSVAGPNSITLAFHPTDAANYNGASNTVTINVNKILPVVTLNNTLTINYKTAVTAAMINAHANVSGSFTYDGLSTPPATIYTAAGPNTITVVFHPTNSTNYSEVTNTVTINVNKIAPVITWTNPATIAYGTALGDAQLYATANVDGKFDYLPVAGTVLPAGSDQPLTVIFTPTDPNYTALPKQVSINVTKVPLIITANNQSRGYGQPNPELSLSYNGLVNGDTPASLTSPAIVSTVATQASPAGTYAINVSGAASGNYNITYVSGTVTVTTVGRDITFDKLSVKTYGDADFDAGAVATTGEPVIYTSSNPAIAAIVDGKVHIVGAGYVTITASLAPNPSYNTTPSVSQFMIVNKATQVIDFASIPAQMRGTTYDLSGIKSSSGLPVTFTVNDEKVASVNGLTLSSLRIGITGIVANQAGNANYYPAVAVVRDLKVEDPIRDVIVHPAVSPNADGINDFLYIEGIAQHPDNRVTIINRNGVRVYEINGYNNGTKSFDGHSNFTGSSLQAGTYFYLVEYVTDGVGRHLTGYFVLKYQ